VYGVEARRSCRGLFEKLDNLSVPCQYILSLIVFVIDNQNNFYTGLYTDYIQETNINFTSLLQIFLLLRRDSLTQELGYLIDCSVIFSISGMKGCDLRINFLNVLLFVLFHYGIFRT
jgi:hypothetical protein